MDHAAAEDLHPFVAGADLHRIADALIAHIHLGGRFGEGEVVRAELRLHLVGLEEGGDEIHQRALEVTHMGLPVDHQAFDLMEHRRVGLVPVAAIDAARRDDADRRLAFQHGADLHRRSVRAQDFAQAGRVRLHEEGVLGVAGRVTFRKVQRGEVVEIVLDIRTFSDGKAHISEDHRQLFHHLGDRVQRALRLRPHRQGHIHRLRDQGGIQGRGFQIRLARLDQVTEPGLETIERRAHHLAFLRAHPAQLAHHQRHRALLAQRPDAHSVQRRLIGRAINLAAHLGFKRVEIGSVGHVMSSHTVGKDLAAGVLCVDREWRLAGN